MSRMSEMSIAMHEFCNENYGPEDIPGPDDLDAKAEMFRAIQAWIECPAQKRPSADALAERIRAIAASL